MTDPDLIRAAIEASGLSARRFAREVLGVDERTVRYWLAGDRPLLGTPRRVCAAIVASPGVAAHLRAAGPSAGS